MTKIKDQRIILWCNRIENLNELVINAVYFARFLEKEVCCFANYTNSEDKERLKNITSNTANLIKTDIPELQVSTLTLKGQLHNLVGTLGDEFNGVLFFCNGKMDQQLLKAFYNSNMPFFFSRGINAFNRNFKKVVIGLDFRNNTKDATLWGSYLGRFNQSDILLLKASDTNKTTRKQVDDIEAFVRKFYKQFIFNYRVENGQKGSFGIQNEALLEAEMQDLLIVSGSRNVTLPDYIAGPFEKRLVNKAQNVSVLLINPQRDMYALCD